MIWYAVIAAAVGCYLFKLAGLSVPERILSDPRTRLIAALLPVGLLAALIATQTFVSADHRLTLDPRAAGLGVAVIAILLRAPFLIVVGAAVATTALLRLVL
ncbi:branched-chain amino acid transporter AzlD [Sphaerisporangium siamense]|uniref:Branched-subunit amino acid transport protein n=1 Tax=Sphaerisporangium siamense TaxID=795645 RepID=A0A7W7GBZ5_9ACTN|nr:AzlD domain-containing protein [Sphaerisporangium siamense]MBB4701486.1 branched-subunit amino acid transport protein [Sphaerisporangium siamense]GII85610.1 branched-chain amino acid transporter AzlD [Sphaerisporangium siamense]